MIELMPQTRGGVIAATLTGQVGADDFDAVLIPAVERGRSSGEPQRLLLHYPDDFKRFTTTAAWDHETVGLHHLDGFEKTAIVTNVTWLEALATRLAAARPDAIRHFAAHDVDVAREWISTP